MIGLKSLKELHMARLTRLALILSDYFQYKVVGTVIGDEIKIYMKELLSLASELSSNIESVSDVITLSNRVSLYTKEYCAITCCASRVTLNPEKKGNAITCGEYTFQTKEEFRETVSTLIEFFQRYNAPVTRKLEELLKNESQNS